MKFLKLNSNQHIELVPQGDTTIVEYITEAIRFVDENHLECADLIVDGFMMGIYPDDYEENVQAFIHQLTEEFYNYKKNHSIHQ